MKCLSIYLHLQNFNNIKASAAAAANADVTQRPLVAWVYYQPGNPAWGIYGREQIQIQFAAYMSEYSLVRLVIWVDCWHVAWSNFWEL